MAKFGFELPWINQRSQARKGELSLLSTFVLLNNFYKIFPMVDKCISLNCFSDSLRNFYFLVVLKCIGKIMYNLNHEFRSKLIFRVAKRVIIIWIEMLLY